jgi:SAM-dependent methyltransferase
MVDLPGCPACGGPTGDCRAVDRIECGDVTRMTVRLVECPDCRHVFIHPQPIADELAPFYATDYHVYAHPPDPSATADRMIRDRRRNGRLNHAVIPSYGGRYLDVGCGLGEFVIAMGRCGAAAEGVEPGLAAVERATAAGARVFHGLLHEAAFPDGSFDSISLVHVLEHTPDPLAVLRECRRILRPSGELFLGVPNYDALGRRWLGREWDGLDVPRHLHHFRAPSIRRLAGRAGLKVEQLTTETLAPCIELNLGMALRRRAFVPARLTLGLHLMSPLARWMTHRGNATGGGEALNLHLRRDDVPSDQPYRSCELCASSD